MSNVVSIRKETPQADLSPLAVADLARSGISPEQAASLGMFSVENARADLNSLEFREQAAIVLPYYNISGDIMHFERDGQRLPFCRVRYLGEPPPQKSGFRPAKKLGK